MAKKEPGIPVTLTQGVPPKEVVINPNSSVSAGEGDARQTYGPGEKVTLPGPEADQLVLGGYATYA